MAKAKLFLKFKDAFPKFFSILLILIGSAFLYLATADRFSTANFQSKSVEATEAQVKPLKIFIPKLDKTLAISGGFVTNNRWTVSETGVSFLTTSAVPGNLGNAVLYGHNRDAILGKLWKVQSGDLVYVVLSDGSISKYQIFERKEVKPNEVEILGNVGDSRLTIYTCSGFLDSARFVVVGELVS